MRPNNRTYSKRFIVFGLFSVLLIGLSFPLVIAEEFQLPKEFQISEHFTFYGSGGIDWQALHDPNNNPILIACLKQATSKSLQKLGITDLQRRLSKLEQGNLIKKAENGYILAFPTVMGQKRDQLQKYVEEVVPKLVPVGQKTIAEIRPHLRGREKMLYHVLWSDIMDGPLAWNAARAEMTKQVKSGDTSIDNKAWLLYPPHPFRVGTNSYSTAAGHLRITWNNNSVYSLAQRKLGTNNLDVPYAQLINVFYPRLIHRICSEYGHDIVQSIRQNEPLKSREAKEALNEYGLVDKTGRVKIYAVESNGKATEVYMNLGKKFGQEIMAFLNVSKVSDILDVPPGVSFVIAYHEICWQLLQELAEKKFLDVPHILTEPKVDPKNTYHLVSLAIVPKETYPFLQTEMSEEEKTIIKRFDEIKEKILAGEKYFNLSTPVDAQLSYMSAVILQDGEALKKSIAMKWEGPVSFHDGWIQQCKNTCIFRVQACQTNPSEGDVHPIYVRYLGDEREFSDVHVLVYHQGKWIHMFNEGNPDTDWRESVDRIKTRLLK